MPEEEEGRERYAPESNSICHECAHKRDGMKCDAFPEQIPIEIYIGEYDHREFHKDDGGIKFTTA